LANDLRKQNKLDELQAKLEQKEELIRTLSQQVKTNKDLKTDEIAENLSKTTPQQAVAKMSYEIHTSLNPMDLAQLKGAKILLVEDNPINQDVTMAMLSQKEMITKIAGDGQQAIAMLQTEEFDCVLMDIQMPVMDGYEATKAIRADKRFADLPILAMTANALSSDKEHSLQAGMNSHISKPIDIEIFLKELLKWIDIEKVSKRNLSSSTDPPAPVQNEPEASCKPVDFDASLERVGGDLELQRKILQAFVDKHNLDHEKFKTLLLENRLEAANDVLHSLKGVAQVVGSNELFLTVSKLDTQLEKGETAEVSLLMDSFERILGRTIRAIKEYLVER